VFCHCHVSKEEGAIPSIMTRRTPSLKTATEERRSDPFKKDNP